MIPQTELDRALARWKARKLGHDFPTSPPEPRVATGTYAVADEPTRVALPEYQSEVVTPAAEVHLSDDDYEVHTRIDPRK